VLVFDEDLLGNWFGGGWSGAFKDESGCLEPDGLGWRGSSVLFPPTFSACAQTIDSRIILGKRPACQKNYAKY